MPPQQPDRPLDLFDDSFDFSAHDTGSAMMFGSGNRCGPKERAARM
jgi:hypothetical protein